LAWFPDYLGGRLIWVDGDWGVFAYNPDGNSWIQLYQGNGADRSGKPQLAGMAGQPVFAKYSSLCQCVVFGGGTGIYRLNSDGSANSMTLSGFSPGTLNITPSSNASIAVDPASGHLVAIVSGAIYDYDPTGSGTWTNTGRSYPAFFDTAGGPKESLISASVSDYGVIMYVKCNDSTACNVYVYRHSAAVPASSLPNAPVNLIVK
jgi:hypothetical protein